MALLPEELKQVLTDSGFVSESDFNQTLETSRNLEKSISDILIFKGLISEQALGQLIAEYLKVPYISLKSKSIPLELLQKIPEKLARAYRIIPFWENENEFHIAMEDPKNFEALERIRRSTSKTIIPHYISPPDLSQALNQYKKEIKKEFSQILTEHIKKTGRVNQEDITKVAVDLPVIKILDTILEYAIAERTSDIHIETLQNALAIRFRIDGQLKDIIKLPKEIQPAIIARIKILSQLKIDEHRIPQDGRFKFTFADQSLALRVSIIPSFYGENAVMRLLFESNRPLSLEEVGLVGQQLNHLRSNIKKPHGMILVTGPTGSGKTTTLYSILNILNSIKVNICTVEDPIEYGIHRVNQIQVNPDTGLTFAAGLRALLRHDPNIIMVGEIRDQETAEMAIHASLTGHLVLSTLHTNDAAGAIPRLLDMDIEGFLVASTVNVVIAQRLVRRLCPICIVRIEPDQVTINLFAKYRPQVKKISIFKSQGCDECNHSGYKGRIGIFEVLEVSGKIRELITQKISGDKILAQAQKEGMTLMIEDGLDKASSGLTTIEEVIKAVRDIE
jgi:type IV pilus assembly protein PilB